MEEPKYINYGNLQVDLNQFLTSVANDIEPYLNRQPWSNKRKELFRKAYSDIMSLGVTGASNTSGFWEINHGGLKIDLDSKSLIEREMYGEAAYYILLKMSGLAIDKLNTEEEKKKDLKTLDNQTFISGLENYIGTQRFGGLNWNIGGPEDLWNKLDSRNEKGIRGRKNRADALAKYLEEYGATINETTHSFENSPFTDYQDFKTRLDAAVLALRNNPDTSDDALNALGINPSRYFNNGSGDTFSKGDYTGTYGGYQEYLALLRDALAKLRAAEIASRPTMYTNTIKNNGFLYLQRDLADLYGSTEGLLNQVRLYLTKGLNNLTNNEKAEVRSAMVYGAKNPISNEEWEQLKNSPSLKGASRNRFKKINGIDNLFLDSATGNVIHLYDLNFRDSIGNDFLAGLSSENLEKEYLNSVIPGLTSAESKELWAIGLDIASIINPEPVTAGGMGVAAATLRNLAKNETPGHKWSFWEGVGQGLDYLTGVLGAVDIGGDLILAGKTIIKGSKVLPIIQKGLRYAMRYGSWKDIYDGALSQEGRQTVDKIINGEELTVLDWRHIGEVIRGIAGHHILNKSNRVDYKTAEKLGLQTEATSNLSRKMGSNDFWRKTGFASSKVKTQETSSTLKLSKTKEDGSVETKDISISPQLKEQLEEAFRKVKPSERTAEAKKILGNDKIGDFEVVTETGWRAKARNWNQYTRKTEDSFGLNVRNLPNRGIINTNEFNNWINNRGYLNKVLYGTDGYVRNSANKLLLQNSNGTVNTLSGTVKLFNEREIPPIKIPSEELIARMKSLEKSLLDAKNNELSKDVASRREAIKNYKENPDIFSRYANGKIKHSGNALSNEKFEIEGYTFDINTYPGQSDGNVDLSFGGITRNIQFKNREDLMKLVGKLLEEIRVKTSSSGTTKSNYNKTARITRELKKRGVFKYGGRIDRLKMQQYKEFMKR